MTDLHTSTDPLRILYMPLPLTSRSGETDWANARAVYRMLRGQYHVRWPTHLLIVTRSWQETPDALDHSVIEYVVRICKYFGLPIIWGRWLWVGWPSDKLEAPMPGETCYVLPEYHATAIARVQAEAYSIGAAGTMLMAEPDGQPLVEAHLQAGFDDISRGLMQRAIRRAVAVTGQVDFIYPAGSSDPRSYAWSVVDLGKLRLIHKTYELTTADGKVVMHPPDGVKAKLDLWGHWVGENKLSPADVRGFDMARVRERFHENVGQWIYIRADKFAEVVKGWNG